MIVVGHVLAVLIGFGWVDAVHIGILDLLIGDPLVGVVHGQ
jgi:hypothetical protein